MRHLLALPVVLSAQAPLQQLRVALDAREGRSELVADDGQEVVLDACRCLLTCHPFLEIGPQLRVLQGRAGALGDRLRHPKDALLERTVAATCRGENALEATAG